MPPAWQGAGGLYVSAMLANLTERTLVRFAPKDWVYSVNVQFVLQTDSFDQMERCQPNDGTETVASGY
jgi:hypothetical protein